MAPKLSHWKDLTSLSEDFVLVEGQPSSPTFLRTIWTVLDEDDVLWRGQANVRKYFITLAKYEAGLERVPDEFLFPEYTPEMTIAPNDGVGNELFIKRSAITEYDPDMTEDDVLSSTPKAFLNEIRIMELLAKHPHPNIVRYHGCRVRRGLVTGLVFDRHGTNLDILEHDGNLRDTIDKDSIMTGIESAVSHLHSLGLAHNDLNPSNVVVGKNQKAILVDFGSCQPFGEKLVSMGTTGWVDEDFTTSSKEHDLAALSKIRGWMDNVHQALPSNLPSLPVDSKVGND